MGVVSHSQSNQTSLEFRIGWSATTVDQVLQSLPTRTDNRAMEFILNRNDIHGLFSNLIRNGKDRSFSSRYSLLRPAYGDICQCARVVCFVDINLGASLVLDFVDTDATFTKNTCHCASGNSESEDVIGLFLKFKGFHQLRLGTRDTFLATLDQDFVRLQLLSRFAFTIFRRPTRERDFDRIFLLEAGSVFAALTNEGRVVLAGNLENLRGFIGLLGTIVERVRAHICIRHQQVSQLESVFVF